MTFHSKGKGVGQAHRIGGRKLISSLYWNDPHNEKLTSSVLQWKLELVHRKYWGGGWGGGGTIKVANIMDPLHNIRKLHLGLCFIECLKSFVYYISSWRFLRHPGDGIFFVGTFLHTKLSSWQRSWWCLHNYGSHINYYEEKRRDNDSLINNKTRVQQ